MKIEILGSPMALTNLSRSYAALSSQKESELVFRNSIEDFIRPIEIDANQLHVKVVDRWNSDAFYADLNRLEQAVALTLIDNGSTAELSTLIQNKDLISRVLGLQGHCFQGSLEGVPEDRIYRLKDLKLHPDIGEVILRTSDVAVFNLNVIRRSDQVGSLQSNTTGLTIEEACLLAKYIGASDLIKNVVFAGVDLENDPCEMMSTNLANLIWYLQEGLKMRKMDESIENTENLVFSVVPDALDIELEFVKSTNSGRWWVKVPTDDGNMHMACSKKDYDLACENQITDRLSKAFQID